VIVPATGELVVRGMEWADEVARRDLSRLTERSWKAIEPLSGVDVLNRAAPVLVAAFLVALVATPIARRIALARGIVDRPDGDRKMHREPTAYLGGLAVFAGLVAAILVARMLPIDELGYPVMPLGVIVGMVAIMLAGLGDDVGGWDPRTKIAGQLVAAAGLAISEIGTGAAEGALTPLYGLLVDRADHVRVAIPPAWALGEVVTWQMIFDGVSYWAGVALIAIFVLGLTNATNLIDGLDGLCSGTTAIFAAGVLAVSVMLVPMGADFLERPGAVVAGGSGPPAAAVVESGESAGMSADATGTPVDDSAERLGPWPPADVPPGIRAKAGGSMVVARVVLAMALLGAVLGFLPWNFNPAVIFLGDCGSLMLGYVCAVLILMMGDEGRTDFVLAGLIIFALPIMDMVLAIVRRRLAGVSMTAADREHLHHQVQRATGTVRRAVLVLYGVAALFAVLGAGLVALVMADVQARAIYAVAIVLFGFIGVLALKAARHGPSAASGPAPEHVE
jgi:UDP-GlcNAc:undecaprenyl-phosphate GlcNAc-1-phosphate transferase